MSQGTSQWRRLPVWLNLARNLAHVCADVCAAPRGSTAAPWDWRRRTAPGLARLGTMEELAVRTARPAQALVPPVSTARAARSRPRAVPLGSTRPRVLVAVCRVPWAGTAALGSLARHARDRVVLATTATRQVRGTVHTHALSSIGRTHTQSHMHTGCSLGSLVASLHD